MSLPQLDGANDTPQEKPGRQVEVEGREFEEGEGEFMQKYPHIAQVRSQEEMEAMMMFGWRE